jgi:hypothetical protein
MKKLFPVIILVLMLGMQQANAQRSNINFFESNGIITNSTLLNNDLSYTITHLDHRADDVVWAHVVYSIIDLRDVSNSQLAFPIGQDVQHKNLFRLLSEGVVKKIPVYYPNESGISPYFDQTNIIPLNKLSDVFYIETNVTGAQYIDPLFEYDSISKNLKISNRIYDRFSKEIKKFIVQKVYYFDKHLSTLGSKIIGIAPIQSAYEPVSFGGGFGEEEENAEAGTLTLRNTLKESILGWFLYDDLKAHLSGQPIYQESNAATRVSYHEYFTKKMYTDYLIGDNNLFKRLYGNTGEITLAEFKSEINRIERELIEIESDIFAK